MSNNEISLKEPDIETAEDAISFCENQFENVDLNRSVSYDGTLMEDSSTGVIEGQKRFSRSDPNIETLKRKEFDLNENPPPFSSFMLALPMRNNSVDQVTVGHQAMADTLALLLPLAGFPSNENASANINPKFVSFPPWKYKGVQKNIHIFTMPPVGTVNTVAGVTLFNHPYKSVWDVLKNPGSRVAYDPLMRSYELIEDTNEYTKVIRSIFSTRHCIVNLHREVIATVSERVLSEGRYISVSRSTQHPNYPVQPKLARMNVSVSAFLVEAVSTEHAHPLTRVTHIVKVDLPKLPRSVLDYVLKQQPLCLAYARDKYSW